MVFSNNSMYPNSLAIEAAKYLIQLYASTEYHCTRQKLQKLIIFAHLARLIDQQDGILGNEPITATTVGLGVESISTQFNTINFNGVDRIQSIKIKDKLPNEVFALPYRCNENLLGENIYILNSMFEKFGAYPSDLLSEITRKMQLYPKNTNFMVLPSYMKIIALEDVDRYVDDVRNQNKIYGNGTQIMQHIVAEKAESLKNIYIDNLYV